MLSLSYHVIYGVLCLPVLVCRAMYLGIYTAARQHNCAARTKRISPLHCHTHLSARPGHSTRVRARLESR
ncbi:hypothetical protein BP00DRAFT_162322 [Aspergillus indologenus CBS 114.80]|uniref:Uncharacterized protein n=1 Tax=Aspergillus indologenus CBS 114.80 TaxID=1450541 RepID=A0A2V5IDF0_9EURO|nr:hypothetical protein BP00DRAFT_162322 [Aspergillus indologenus CBS 114.80]